VAAAPAPAGLPAGGVMAVPLIWWSAADSPLAAITLVLALSTTPAMHLRLAFGRAIAAFHVTLSAAALAMSSLAMSISCC
jgi:hypothetical protein